jgi:predicted phosphodiesterase
LSAIRGNIDRTGRCGALPATELVELGGTSFYMLHSLGDLDLDPVTAGIGVVVSGHSHRALIAQRRAVLYLNPGSAGPRRFSLPVTLGIVRLAGSAPEAEIITLLQN